MHLLGQPNTFTLQGKVQRQQENELREAEARIFGGEGGHLGVGGLENVNFGPRAVVS